MCVLQAVAAAEGLPTPKGSPPVPRGPLSASEALAGPLKGSAANACEITEHTGIDTTAAAAADSGNPHDKGKRSPASQRRSILSLPMWQRRATERITAGVPNSSRRRRRVFSVTGRKQQTEAAAASSKPADAKEALAPGEAATSIAQAETGETATAEKTDAVKAAAEDAEASAAAAAHQCVEWKMQSVTAAASVEKQSLEQQQDQQQPDRYSAEKDRNARALGSESSHRPPQNEADKIAGVGSPDEAQGPAASVAAKTSRRSILKAFFLPSRRVSQLQQQQHNQHEQHNEEKRREKEQQESQASGGWGGTAAPQADEHRQPSFPSPLEHDTLKESVRAQLLLSRSSNNTNMAEFPVNASTRNNSTGGNFNKSSRRRFSHKGANLWGSPLCGAGEDGRCSTRPSKLFARCSAS